MSSAILILEDGRVFEGSSYGKEGTTLGELVFATGMTGYQETLTDPSYAGQIVVQTAPHIGNTGVNSQDEESDQIWVAGYVVRDPSRMVSNFRAESSLDEELLKYSIVGISGIDTRALTRHLRSAGAMRAGILSSINTSSEVMIGPPALKPGIVRGTEPAANTMLRPCNSWVPPAASCTVTVRFAPSEPVPRM